ncbi:MAG: S-methyl-5'-thioinosine phosphorylase [Methylococcaceae bacterium]|nr:S-methyl-5'-thioinosine phosphorylase [Methylococcaceae bacterium]MCI0667020.1 S-methyl-5'-thioinosine phosphorylase [Methylococcaceae bacterium]
MLAIIGGSGLGRLQGLEIRERKSVSTEYGEPSARLSFGRFHDLNVVFLARHGDHHSIPPHRINYRANIRALQSAGVTHIVSVAAVGGIGAHLPPATIAVPDQLIDYTHGRKSTFFEDPGIEVTHIDFTWPYSKGLIDRLGQSAELAGLKVVIGGTYGCTQGPRLETAAEILRMERDGCDMVGMTGMPEAALAREAGIEYACCAVMANWAAGKSPFEITMQEIERNLAKGLNDVALLLEKLVGLFEYP